MVASPPQELKGAIPEASASFYRLVLLVGPPRSGKTQTLRHLHAEGGYQLINVSLDLAERLMETPKRSRALSAARVLDTIAAEHGSEALLLDNTELLFQPELQLDPLRLLQGLSRNRTIIASWRGTFSNSVLYFASPDHPEFRRYEHPEARIVTFEGRVAEGGAAPPKEREA